MDRAVFGATRSPAALGLHAAVIGLHARLLRARTDAVRHLVEAVLERLGADLDRLEEDVVLGVARHSPLLSVTSTPFALRSRGRRRGASHEQIGPARFLAGFGAPVHPAQPHGAAPRADAQPSGAIQTRQPISRRTR